MFEDLNILEQRVSMLEAQVSLLTEENEDLKEILKYIIRKSKQHNCKCNHDKREPDKKAVMGQKSGIYYIIVR